MNNLQELKDAIALLENQDIEKVKRALELVGAPVQSTTKSHADMDFLIGGQYLFRSVTMYVVGKVESRTGSFIELTTASWVADTGRFSDMVKDGTLSEVEPTGDHWLNLDTVVDFIEWKHTLPAVQK